MKNGNRAFWVLISVFVWVQSASIVSAAEWPKAVSVATASIGGSFYYAGTALAKIFEKMDVKPNVEVTGGSVHNVKLINSKQVLFAVMTQGTAYEGYNGIEWAKDKYTNFRSIMVIAPGFAQGWTLPKSNIRDFRDFNGKVVSGGPGGGASDMYLRAFGELLGVKFGKVVSVSFADTINLIQDGMLDVGWASGAAFTPHPAANELTSTLGGAIVGFRPEDVKKLIEKYPSHSATEIPANTYKNQPNPVLTVSDWAGFFAHKDVPDDMVYRYLELTFANVDLLVATQNIMKDLTPQNQKYLALPLHPGAFKFYKDKGISIPEKVLPPRP